jgi:hypothetical protein
MCYFLFGFISLSQFHIHLQFGSSDRATLFEKLSPEFKIRHAINNCMNYNMLTISNILSVCDTGQLCKYMSKP